MDPQSDEFTYKQGQYLAFIDAYVKLNRRAPAESDFQRYFRVSPPTVHNMSKTLTARQLIERKPGVARSITLRIDSDRIPPLDEA
ncbi:MarR family transcriptional regulator [Stieleria sp. JC731]|uniref:MarR family transcriptional regulator n=1 Tax=Pirellulaceae TaxID=2691357 RepID=UPI001E28E452|nr:MarR family transcriptional regulator [Stieleria sp. JC731]MCC9602973.1 MarR family transcriptional regulator [Stieleria sp. JC731]